MKEYVIVSLPSPDDPSQGKTVIAAFALPVDHDDSMPLPPPPPPPPPHRSLLTPRRALAALLGSSLLLASLWLCLFSDAPFQLLRRDAGDERRRDDAGSFLFTLYPKHGSGRVLQLAAKVKLDTSNAAATVVNSSAAVVFPLRGNAFPDAQNYASVVIGNPPKPYYLDVDTGSDLTWIQCDAPCASCAKGPHPLYKPAKGKLVPPRDSLCLEVQSNQNYRYCDKCQQCDYEIEYADHSSSMGVLAKDEIKFFTADVQKVKIDIVFGCAYDQQGQLLNSPAKTDGILGLSSAKISLLSQLASHGIINNVLGHCIKSELDGGGYMFLGDDFVPRWGMTWVPMLSTLANFYHAEVLKLSYGRQQISVKEQDTAGKVVFDTGSSYTYFTNEVYTNLIASLESISTVFVRDDSDPLLPVCWHASSPGRSVKDVKQFFEPLTLHFGKKWWIISRTLSIAPEDYLVINNKGNVCLGVLNGTEVHDGSTIILGDNFLRGKLVVYDNVQQKIGWVHSDCAEPQKRTREFPFFF